MNGGVAHRAPPRSLELRLDASTGGFEGAWHAWRLGPAKPGPGRYTGILAVIPRKLRRALNHNHVQVLMTDDLISDDQSQPCASARSVPVSSSITLADVIDVAGALPRERSSARSVPASASIALATMCAAPCASSPLILTFSAAWHTDEHGAVRCPLQRAVSPSRSSSVPRRAYTVRGPVPNTLSEHVSILTYTHVYTSATLA